MPAAVHLVLRDADPTGIVIATRDNWTGKAYGLPIGDLRDLVPALDGAGIYVLMGESADEDDPDPVLYVGEAEDVTKRLSSGHAQLSRGDVEWRRVVVFASQSDDLHKAHVKWLETKLIERARRSSRWRLTNGATPVPPRLPEFETVFVEAFLDNMLVLYPLLGVDAFAEPRIRRAMRPVATQQEGDPLQEEATGSSEPSLPTELMMKVAGSVRARATLGPDGRVTLLAGSQLAEQGRDSESPATSRLRNRLVSNGNTRLIGDGWLELKVSHGPLSPSAAAKLVAGYSVSGPVYWKDARGTSLGALLNREPAVSDD
jgi:hypothetical protein